MSTESPFLSGAGTDADDRTASTEHTADEVFSDDDGVLYDEEVTPEFGIIGFTLRELLIVGVWAIAFIASFFPHLGGVSIWGTGIQWVLPVGVPTAAVFLLILRRFSPDGIRRVGSLGIDQFASVAFSVAAVYWLGALWSAVTVAIEIGAFGLSWNGVVQLIAALALVVLTVFAPLVPGLKEDFQGRLVTLAHRNANPVRPVIPRPRPEPTAATVAADSAPVTADSAPVAADATADEALQDSSWTTDASAQEQQAPVQEPPTPAQDWQAPAQEQLASGSAQPAGDHALFVEPTLAADPVQTDDLGADFGQAPVAGDASASSATPAYTTTPLPAGGLDVELSGEHATDEVARIDLAEQVPLAAHASGGGTGTEDATADEEYVPAYSRRSRGQTQEILSDTGSIESLLGATAYDVSSPRTVALPTIDDEDDRDETAAHAAMTAAQPFWILAQTERDVHDERGDAIFRIGPSAWALVIEDRGGAYVIRHDDGRIGYLHDIADITKG
ncbi:hypothetical protein [Microbacterium sp. Root553]|uniref:hypothetical protein n=1 Tax=Microbacterium sp. Root553 TaxID=1736556 RepID=UPI000A9F3950|nr:hypothetical protein [Microbacterium sp. Root553]